MPAPPVLLLPGLGIPAAAAFWRTERVLAAAGRTALRVELSAACDTTEAMAQEAVAALDDAGAERADVYGWSLGGMIAQRLALDHPGRVRRIVLASTGAGGPAAVPAGRDARAFYRLRGELGAEAGAWASVPYCYAEATRRARGQDIADDVARIAAADVAPEAYAAHLAAVRAHDTADRLGAIAAPVLVLHGEEDRMVPPGNGARLAEGISGARLVSFPGAGHVLQTDAPGADAAAAAFLA